MALVCTKAACLTAVLLFSSSFHVSYGFQSGIDAKVSIEPRLRPRAVGESDFPRPTLRVDVSLTLIPVHVTTEEGLPVTNLGPENFRITEEDVPQDIAYFSKDDAPLSVGLVYDTSGSMHNKKDEAVKAASEFFKTANVEDQFFLVEFNERPKLSVGFTSNPDDLYERLARLRTSGRTALLDAIHLGITQMKSAANTRKAIVVLSDGADNRSRHTFAEVKNLTLESDVQVYAMGIFSPTDQRKTEEEENGPLLLDELTQKSGGRHYRVDNISDLPSISARISDELRSQYLIGFISRNPARDGKYRRVKITLNPPEGMPMPHIRYRQGYYAPSR